VAVKVRHFQCLQEKEAKQTVKKAFQRGRRKERGREEAGRRIRQ
jgi:hypothetical protein